MRGMRPFENRGRPGSLVGYLYTDRDRLPFSSIYIDADRLDSPKMSSSSASTHERPRNLRVPVRFLDLL